MVIELTVLRKQHLQMFALTDVNLDKRRAVSASVSESIKVICIGIYFSIFFSGAATDGFIFSIDSLKCFTSSSG